MDEIEQLFGQSSAHPARNNSSDSPWALLILLIGSLILLFLLVASGYVVNFSEQNVVENNLSIIPKMSPILSETTDVYLDQHMDIHLPQVEINYIPLKKEEVLKENPKEPLPKEEEKKNLFLRQKSLFMKHLKRSLGMIFHVGRLK